MPSPAFVSLSPPSSFLPRSSSPVSLPLRPSLFPSAPPRILRAAPCATLADGLVRTPAPGEAGGAPFSAADWDNAQRDESVGAQAWDALKEIVPYRALRKIAKTGAYLGNELGAVHKEWDAAEVRFVLAYPDAYSIGMSSTGHVVLYSCLNESDRLLCDRAYVPGVDMQAALKEAGKPVFAVESKRPLADFHVVGMSISYELCATNCLAMMELGHLPKTWAERDAASPTGRFLDGPPLVFAGGLTITANPEPYCDFFDFFSLGDGEDVLPAIGEKIADVLKVDPDVTREELTLVLAKEIPGVYAPRFYEMDEGAAVARPIRTDVPARPQRQNAIPEPQRALALVPQTDAIHDRLSIEIRRGCTRGCRFCLPGMVQRPARDVEPDHVVEAVKAGVEATGYNEFSLLSLSCSDWLSLPSVGLRLKNELAGHNISLSLGSQRVDRFDENIANVAGGLRKSGLTFAPEGGSQRLRDVINKGLSAEELLRGVQTAYEQGWASVKLYFLIGLPTETDEDIMGICKTIRFLQKRCRAPGRRRLALTVTISNFTPKPFTPFQWHTVSTEEFKRKQQILKKEFEFIRDVKLNFTDTRLSAMEDFIGRGDRRLGPVIARAHELGAGMDGWWESMDKAYNAWCQAIEENGLSWKYRLTEDGEWNIAETSKEDVRGKRGWYEVAKAENLDRKTLLAKDGAAQNQASDQNRLDMPLPWDIVDNGIDKGWLRDELMKALDGSLTPDCAFHECSMCGICGDDMGNNVTIAPPPIPEYLGETRPSEERSQRIRLGFERSAAMSMSSHLDTTRMLDRLLRRAGIPISFDGGFHPHPRIVTAAALPFGATAGNELIDFYLHSKVPVDEFAARVQVELPDGMRISSAEDVPVVASKTAMLMESADYVFAVYLEPSSDSPAEETARSETFWDDVVERVLAHGPVEVEKITKRGGKSMRDLRSMLFSLRRASAAEAEPVLTHIGSAAWPETGVVLAATTELTNLGALSPDAFIQLLRLVSGDDRIELLHAHRQRISIGHDERYERVKVIQAFEQSRRAMKPKVNRWTRTMYVSMPALNEPWVVP